MYNLHRLRMLHELRRLGTVTAVAQSLHFTHSSVSEQLRQLEVEVGYPLLEKVGRRLQLTEQGEIIADYAARMLGLADQALTDVAAATGEVTDTAGRKASRAEGTHHPPGCARFTQGAARPGCGSGDRGTLPGFQPGGAGPGNRPGGDVRGSHGPAVACGETDVD